MRSRLLATDDFEFDTPAIRDTTALRTLLERAIEREGNPARLARRLEVTPSHISRLCKGVCSLGVEVLLRLADVLDEDGVAVVATCGHPRLARRLELLRRGSPQRPRHLLYDAIDQLSERDRDLVTVLVARLLATTPEQTPLPSPDPQTRSYR